MSGTVLIVPRDGDDEAALIAALKKHRKDGDTVDLSTAGPRLSYVVNVELARRIDRGPVEDSAKADNDDDQGDNATSESGKPAAKSSRTGGKKG